MYEIVMKNHPFKSNNIADLMNKINNNKPILTNSNFSSECKELITSLLIVDYNKRLDWNDVFTNNWIFCSNNKNNENNENNENNDNIDNNNIINKIEGEMYFEDIYNSVIEDIEKLEVENIENIENIEDIEKLEVENIKNIENTINTPMTKPIDIKKNIENDYIFVNKPNNKSVLNTLMDNSNEIINKIKKMI